MSSNLDKEYICTLHSKNNCDYYYSYERSCRLKIKDGYVTASCPYRLEAVVLAAAKPVESPENVVQQPQQETPADFVEGVDQ